MILKEQQQQKKTFIRFFLNAQKEGGEGEKNKY